MQDLGPPNEAGEGRFELGPARGIGTVLVQIARREIRVHHAANERGIDSHDRSHRRLREVGRDHHRLGGGRDTHDDDEDAVHQHEQDRSRNPSNGAEHAWRHLYGSIRIETLRKVTVGGHRMEVLSVLGADPSDDRAADGPAGLAAIAAQPASGEREPDEATEDWANPMTTRRRPGTVTSTVGTNHSIPRPKSPNDPTETGPLCGARNGRSGAPFGAAGGVPVPLVTPPPTPGAALGSGDTAVTSGGPEDGAGLGGRPGRPGSPGIGTGDVVGRVGVGTPGIGLGVAIGRGGEGDRGKREGREGECRRRRRGRCPYRDRDRDRDGARRDQVSVPIRRPVDERVVAAEAGGRLIPESAVRREGQRPMPGPPTYCAVSGEPSGSVSLASTPGAATTSAVWCGVA